MPGHVPNPSHLKGINSLYEEVKTPALVFVWNQKHGTSREIYDVPLVSSAYSASDDVQLLFSKAVKILLNGNEGDFPFYYVIMMIYGMGCDAYANVFIFKS